MTDFTTNLHLELTDFNISPWHNAMHDNFRIIDAAMNQLTGIAGVMGIWKNSTAYVVGNKLFDSDGTLWICAVNHTSPAAPTTFAADRAANPSRWNATTAQSSTVLDAIAALTPSANKLINFTSSSAAELLAITTDAKALLAAANFAAMKALLTLHAVATSGAYADLSGKPTLGTVADEDTGVSGHVVPFLDGVNTFGDDQKFTTKTTVKSTNASNGIAIQQFADSGSVRKGYVGLPNAGDDDIALVAESGSRLILRMVGTDVLKIIQNGVDVLTIDASGNMTAHGTLTVEG